MQDWIQHDHKQKRGSRNIPEPVLPFPHFSVLPATTVFREWLRIGPAGHRLDWSGPHLSIVEECRTPERIPGSADAYARAEARIQIQAEPDSFGPECVPEAFALCGVVRLVSGSR